MSKFTGFVKDSTDVQFHFSKKMACQYGLKESIILNNIQFWVITNIANNRNFIEGRTWVYNSAPAWKKILPFFSEKELRGAFQRLIKNGVLLKERFNKKGYDHTNWYAFVDESLWVEKELLEGRNTNNKSQE